MKRLVMFVFANAAVFAASAPSQVTFHKDVESILQRAKSKYGCSPILSTT